MTGYPFGPLRTRDMPQQARAVKRVFAILQATAELLNETSLANLSTSAIAARGGFPVSSVYRYFPTLDDLLRELYLQTAEALRTELFAVFRNTLAYPTWRERLNAALNVQRRYLARHPYYRPLLLHFVVSRVAVAVEDDEHEELVTFLFSRWKSGLDGFRDGDPRIVATTTVQIALSMEDLIAAQADRDASRPFSEELSKVLESYLSRYLHDEL